MTCLGESLHYIQQDFDGALKGMSRSKGYWLTKSDKHTVKILLRDFIRRNKIVQGVMRLSSTLLHLPKTSILAGAGPGHLSS